MSEPTHHELDTRSMRRVLRLGVGEHMVVPGWVPLLPRVAAPAERYLDLPREPWNGWPPLFSLAYVGTMALFVTYQEDRLLFYRALAWLLALALPVVAYFLSRQVRLPVELAVSSEGIELRRGRRRELVAWQEVLDVQRDEQKGMILTRRRRLLFELSAPGAKLLHRAASRVISARRYGRAVRLADWTPDTALSLASDESLGGAEERGISLAREQDN